LKGRVFGGVRWLWRAAAPGAGYAIRISSLIRVFRSWQRASAGDWMSYAADVSRRQED
jgi:hypothetical protein